MLANIFEKIRVDVDDIKSNRNDNRSADQTLSTRTNENKTFKTLSKKRIAKHGNKSLSNKKILRDLVSNDSSSCMSQSNLEDGLVSVINEETIAIREHDNESNSFKFENQQTHRGSLAKAYRDNSDRMIS